MPKCLKCREVKKENKNKVCHYCHLKKANYEANRRFEELSRQGDRER
jgi:hypothetical protein